MNLYEKIKLENSPLSKNEILSKIFSHYPDISEEDEDFLNSLSLEDLIQEVKNRSWYDCLEESDNEICVLCGKPIKGWGNDPWPLSEEGYCCDTCNSEKVIPARLVQAYASKSTDSNKINEATHELREPVDRAKDKVDTIINYVDKINSKLDTNIIFNNKVPNNYSLTIGHTTLNFHTYSDLINALKLIMELNLILY